MTPIAEQPDAGSERAQKIDIQVMDVLLAHRIFGLPNVDHGVQLTQEFRDQMRLLGQIYDTIQRHLTGELRKSDSFYPDIKDVYRDLQIFKRTISDKAPMPPEDEFDRYLLLLATQTRPFIHIVREMRLGDAGEIEAYSRYAAPTEKHPDKVDVAYKSCLRNAVVLFRTIVGKSGPQMNWEEALKKLNNLDRLNLRENRVDFLLRKLYLPAAAGRDANQIRKVNEEIHRQIYRPLLQQLFKDKLILTFSAREIRESGLPGADKMPDLVLFNQGDYLARRYEGVASVMNSDICLKFGESAAVAMLGASRDSDEITPDDFNLKVGEHLLKNLVHFTDFPGALLDVIVEVMKLSVWHNAFEKQKRETDEKDELLQIIKKIKDHGGLLRVGKSERNDIPDRFLRVALMGKIPSVLSCTDPYDSFKEGLKNVDLAQYEGIYVLFKDRKTTGRAIETAIDLYRKAGDAYLLHILENILGLSRVPEQEWKKYLAPAYVDQYREAMREACRKYVPWYVRAWYFITSSDISAQRMKVIQDQLREQNEIRLRRIRRAVSAEEETRAKKEIRRVVQTRAEEKDNTTELREYINSAWERGNYPDAQAILKAFAGEREALTRKILGLVDVGAASVRPLVKISIPARSGIYATTDYLTERREDLIEKFRRKTSEDEFVLNDSKKLALKPSQESLEVYGAILDFLLRL